MSLIIRTTVKPEEIPALYEIEKECFTRDFRWNKTEFTSQLIKCDVWVMDSVDKTSSELAGFLVAKIDRGVGYILTVEVPNKHRGQGIGTLLVEACEKTYKRRGFKQVRLEVFTENPAQIMYFKLGYRVNGFKKDYYEKGKSAILMVKTL